MRLEFSQHKRWILATSAAASITVLLFAWSAWRGPQRFLGGSTLGLWFGVLGAACMVFAGWLPAQRRRGTLTGRHKWSRTTWLKGHIWLGLLSVVFIFCHSGGRWGGTLECWLWGVFALTILSGGLGAVLQHILPSVLTQRVPCEVPQEQLLFLCRELRRQADELIDKHCGPYELALASDSPAMPASPAEAASNSLRAFYERQVRPFLEEPCPHSVALADSLRGVQLFADLRAQLATTAAPALLQALNTLETFCQERRLLLQQAILGPWLYTWLPAHVLLSVALAVLGLAHILTATLLVP